MRIERKDCERARKTRRPCANGTLEYVLPVEEADARAGIDAVGSVAAIHGKGESDPGAWLLFVARVGVGF